MTNWKQLLEKRRDRASDKVRFEARLMSPREHDIWCEGSQSLEPLLLKAIEAFQEILKQGYGAQGYIEESDWAGLSEYYGKVIAQKEQIARKVLAEIKAELEKE